MNPASSGPVRIPAPIANRCSVDMSATTGSIGKSACLNRRATTPLPTADTQAAPPAAAATAVTICCHDGSGFVGLSSGPITPEMEGWRYSQLPPARRPDVLQTSKCAPHPVHADLRSGRQAPPDDPHERPLGSGPAGAFGCKRASRRRTFVRSTVADSAAREGSGCLVDGFRPARAGRLEFRTRGCVGGGEGPQRAGPDEEVIMRRRPSSCCRRRAGVAGCGPGPATGWRVTRCPTSHWWRCSRKVGRRSWPASSIGCGSATASRRGACAADPGEVRGIALDAVLRKTRARVQSSDRFEDLAHVRAGLDPDAGYWE
jgi:hypothetical protein